MIYCENQNKKRKIDLSRLEKVAETALKTLGKRRYEITVTFVSNQKIRAVNRKYLKRDRSTDVISFGYAGQGDYNKEMKYFLGDVIVSTDKAFQNSGKYGTTIFEETALYVIHGILHLSGYDDISEKDRIVMRRKENVLLQKVKEKI